MKVRSALVVTLFAASAIVGIGAPAMAALPSPGVGSAARVFANCTELNKTYPHGVGKSGARDHVRGTTKPVTNFKVSTTVYNQNSKSDRDRDGVACEKR